MSTDTPRLHGAEASPLGRPAAYRDTYAPDLLFPIERQLKRDELGLKADDLPFIGEDLSSVSSRKTTSWCGTSACTATS